ncbi:MAG: serine hydrolase domain-containing protein [Ktedonobacterales bacterium]
MIGADIEAYLAGQSQQGQLSGSVLVRHEGTTLLDAGYGLAEHGTARPNTPETAFQIASVSKQLAAAAILLLQEQGALPVHVTLSRWLPACPAEWKSITLHHLLTHTSGVGHWHDFSALSLYRALLAW